MNNPLFTQGDCFVNLAMTFLAKEPSERVAFFMLPLQNTKKPCSLPLASCRLALASCSLPLVPCRLALALCSLPLVPCRLALVSCNLPLAACRLALASCSLPLSTKYLHFISVFSCFTLQFLVFRLSNSVSPCFKSCLPAGRSRLPRLLPQIVCSPTHFTWLQHKLTKNV